ncbi:MAG TPA: 5'-3' exonuclease H3TH domain-containing protein [Xanthomonadaceae bacterium]|nr:5'-3' exonuclease H3TH domain-containing protein [Xanthomonadaceae bacterium]HRY00403.1 5'-3' exonuclease H3TH domain-containing protein [Xanthomonadaceae bacterium]
MKRSETLFLVDASMYVFRAWHSMPDDFIDVDGHPVNAVHGFTRFLLELLERQRPQHIAVAFDEALESSFRNERYPAYKANRDPAPDSLKRQFQECQAISRSLGLATVVDPRYEADDLIGTLLVRQREAGFKGLILSADKDLSQLLREGDQQWDYARNQRWDHDGVRERYGVRPEQIPDFLGLTGDSSDNIPGVPGIGPKTASALLEHFHDLDSLLARAHEVEFLRLRGAKAHATRLREHAEQARLSRDLATIALDAPIPEHIGDARRQPVDQQAMDGLCERLRFGALSRRRINELPEPD